MKLTFILSIFFCLFSIYGEEKTSSKGKSISGGDALLLLQEGNKRFISGNMEHPMQDEKRRSSLLSSQMPYAVVISCSDSRVPPELIFDQGLGQIFVVRDAGEALSPENIASVEYAVEHLNVELIVILGHQSCGAVKAALSTPDGKSAGSVNLDILINSIKKNIKNSHNANDALMTNAGKAQVNGVARTLVQRSKIIRELAMKGKISLALGIYSLSSGKVDFWSTGVPLVVEEEENEKVLTHTSKSPDEHLKAH